jgi:hypothetical protein
MLKRVRKWKPLWKSRNTKTGFWQLHCAIGCKNAARQIQLSFTYDQYFNITKEAIVENSETIADSDGLAAFMNCRILIDPHSIL